MMARNWTLRWSPMILGNSYVSRRVCRSYWWARGLTREFQFRGLELVGTPRRAGEEDGQLASLHAISSLVTRLLRSAQEGRLVEKAPSEGEMGRLSAGLPVCFSCGRQGHGVNGCSRVDTYFPFLPPWWSVDVRNGQYRVTWTDGTGLGSHPGNEAWSGGEGQPPGSSGIKVRLTPVGELGVRGDVRLLGSYRWSTGWDLHGLRTTRLFRHWEASPRLIVDRMNESFAGPH